MSEDTISGTDDMRPVIATSGAGNWGLYAFIAILALGGFWLFSTLNAAGNTEGENAFPAGEAVDRITSPAPLRLPEGARRLPVDLGPPSTEDTAPQSAPSGPAVLLQPAPSPLPPPPQAPSFAPPNAPAPVLSEPIGPAVVFDRAMQPPGRNEDENITAGGVNATRLANPSYTVPQGTIIPAVLETAFDSTRPGRVRALVQRDVHSFDGTRVLVPRGSRLFGEYEAGLSPGESRAMIQWTRLMRPDGVSISLDSPASDPLGRGGVEGDVDTHFWERLGGGLLNTVLGLGVGVVAGEASGGSTILALPGSTQNIAEGGSRGPRPVLQIDHGTSLSVYVARDLDFSSVDR